MKEVNIFKLTDKVRDYEATCKEWSTTPIISIIWNILDMNSWSRLVRTSGRCTKRG